VTRRQHVPFTRRHFLAAAVAAACGWAALQMARASGALPAATRRGPIELPLAAADLYAPHDLAG
jgi:hypothetical protein